MNSPGPSVSEVSQNYAGGTGGEASLFDVWSRVTKRWRRGRRGVVRWYHLPTVRLVDMNRAGRREYHPRRGVRDPQTLQLPRRPHHQNHRVVAGDRPVTESGTHRTEDADRPRRRRPGCHHTVQRRHHHLPLPH